MCTGNRHSCVEHPGIIAIRLWCELIIIIPRPLNFWPFLFGYILKVLIVDVKFMVMWPLVMSTCLLAAGEGECELEALLLIPAPGFVLDFSQRGGQQQMFWKLVRLF